VTTEKLKKVIENTKSISITLKDKIENLKTNASYHLTIPKLTRKRSDFLLQAKGSRLIS
jgi:hypothetical protein